jgi:hypothetical protein
MIYEYLSVSVIWNIFVVHLKRGGKLKTAKAIKDFVWGL